jgi:hypothetical protein
MEAVQSELKLFKTVIEEREVAGNKLSFKDLSEYQNPLEIPLYKNPEIPGAKSCWRPIFYSFLLLLIADFCGAFAIMIYSALIFKEIGSSFSPNTSALIVFSIQIIGSYSATLLIDRAGRKILMIVSCIGGTLGYIVLASFIYSKQIGFDMVGLEWIPLISFSFTVFLHSLGISSIPLLYIAEISPQKVF